MRDFMALESIDVYKIINGRILTLLSSAEADPTVNKVQNHMTRGCDFSRGIDIGVHTG
jgi:hypothetical protein